MATSQWPSAANRKRRAALPPLQRGLFFSLNPALVACPFVVENFAKVAHINPAPARRTLNEVLPLVLRSPPTRLPMMALEDFICGHVREAARCAPLSRLGQPPVRVSRP